MWAPVDPWTTCNAALHEVWLPFCVIIITTRRPNCSCIEQPRYPFAERGRIRISFLLNQEAVELEHPALRTSYLGWTPGTINHGQKESESMRKRIGQQRGRIKKVDKRVEGRKKQTSSGLIQQNACSGSTLSRIINRRWVTLQEVVKQWERPSVSLCCVAVVQ